MTRKHYELLTRAKNAYHLEDYSLAEKLMNKLNKEDQTPEDLVTLGSIYYRTNQKEKAIKSFNEALNKSPENIEALNNLGIIYGKLEDSEKSEYYFKTAINLNNQRVDILYNLGNLYKQLDRFDEAVELYKQAISLKKEYILPYNNFGVIYEKMGLIPEAIEIYKKGLVQDPNNATLHFNLGIAYEKQDLLSLSEEEYKASIKYKPDWIPALNNLGIVKQKNGNVKKAKELFKQVLKINPGNQEARNNLAIAENQEGRIGKALEILLSTIKDNPEYTKAENNISEIIINHETGNDIAEQLVEASELFPKNLDIQLKTSKTLLESGNTSTSEKILNKITDQDPENLQALSLLSNIYAQTKRFEMARSCINQKKAIPGQKDSSIKELAKISRIQGNFTAAENEINQYLSSYPEEKEAQLMLSDILIEQDKNEEALAILEKTNKLNPDDSHIMSSIAELSQKMGKKNKALSMVRSLIDLQSRRGSQEDMDQLNNNLEIYDQAVRSYEDDTRSAWERNLKILTKMAENPSENDVFESDTIPLPESFHESPIEEDDSLSIIDIGAMEPNLKINEEETTLFLSEEEEDNEELFSEEEYEKESVFEERTSPESIIDNNPVRKPREKYNQENPFESQQPSSFSDAFPQYPPKGYQPPISPPQPYPGPQIITPIPIFPDNSRYQLSKREEDINPFFKKPSYNKDNHPKRRMEDFPEETQEKKNPPDPAFNKQENLTPEKPEEQAIFDPPTPKNKNLTPSLNPEATQQNKPLTFEKDKDKKITSKDITGMLEYLKTLTTSLPEDKNKKYKEDEIPLKVEYIKNKLELRDGLKEKSQNFDRRKSTRIQKVTTKDLNATMAMMKNLAEFLPDKEVRSMLKDKTSRIIQRLNKEQPDE